MRKSPRPTASARSSASTCSPAHRGGGWGRKLAEALIAEARAIGYRELKLDTLEWMTDARKLYAKLGFRECDRVLRQPAAGGRLHVARALTAQPASLRLPRQDCSQGSPSWRHPEIVPR